MPTKLRSTLSALAADRRLQLGGAAVLVAAAIAVSAWAAVSWQASKLPAAWDVMRYGTLDEGGGARLDGHHNVTGTVAELTAPPGGEPDVRFTLTAAAKTIRLSSGKEVHALAFDGRVPGPELRVRQGDLVEVTLVNRDVEDGVSVHWHGLDVPNAEDGVSGVTQDAVPPGRRFTYRFRADQAGTYWYHSHQHSSEQVERGLYGPLVIVPRRPLRTGTLDLTAVVHTFSGVDAIGVDDRLSRRRVAPGTAVRLRIVNTDDAPKRLSLTGVPYRLAAIDGTDLHAPAPVAGRTLVLAAGGRYDLAFTMPATAVRLALLGSEAGIVFGDGPGPTPTFGPELDLLDYGAPAPAPSVQGRFDRTFVVHIGKKLGFLDGSFGWHWSVNGKVYPRTPMLAVRRGELIRITLVNHTRADHPMHLHGHHMLVLSRQGRPVGGSPWWVDTLNVRPGERYDFAVRMTNPGIWMFHCHNLDHAAAGLTFHLVYDGVRTTFVVGGHAHNHPE